MTDICQNEAEAKSDGESQRKYSNKKKKDFYQTERNIRFTKERFNQVLLRFAGCCHSDRFTQNTSTPSSVKDKRTTFVG
jgi:hypothetical protein